MATSRARFHPHNALRQLAEKLADLAATQLSADQNAPFGIGAVDLKHALGKVKTDNANFHRTAPSVVAIFPTTTVGHFNAGEQGPSTPSKKIGH